MKCFLFLFFIVFAVACHTVKTRSADARTPQIRYESLGNDVADIHLRFYSDSKVEIEMMSFGPSGEDERKTIQGKWKIEKDQFVLTFPKRKIRIQEMFDAPSTHSINYTFIDDKTIAFKSSLKIIYLWGIACERKNGS